MAQGKLGKFGKVLDSTPADVKVELESLHNGAGATAAPAEAVATPAMPAVRIKVR